ncbi:DUF421 domain-containing protein [Rubrivirga sp. S365]|uniref:DUF421 domain-containing protein n=1 Tax=Rubrivirga litoralis TaxID=3075598 RepID=A0ABU3BPW9_9BACT|nr:MULTISPECIES: YetF domain-containing protein [unclassified Rubrivirga]MDT0631310.1 DUF421 domain-containing protein [Rubrivirga sp. F394]MDT7855987.1 DUF421 domain-containing protein [Rubrivirga sp. S365]
MDFLFKSWTSLGKTILTAALIYPLLIVVLRAGGKRTLSKMNAFDFIVTVAIGSLLASTVLSTASLAEGVGAIAALVVLQTLITWLSIRSDRFEKLIKSQPTLIFHDGQYIERAMRDQRVTREEIRNAIRTSSSASVEDTAAVVLESDGSFSVLSKVKDGKAEALAGVDGAEGRWDIDPVQGPFTNPEPGVS